MLYSCSKNILFLGNKTSSILVPNRMQLFIATLLSPLGIYCPVAVRVLQRPGLSLGQRVAQKLVKANI